ncbi:hypothetical protein Plhal304r1_c027g0089301 [Plasmopara halstedii]
MSSNVLVLYVASSCHGAHKDVQPIKIGLDPAQQTGFSRLQAQITPIFAD